MNWLCLVLLVLVVCARARHHRKDGHRKHAKARGHQSRIVNGFMAKDEQFPWAAVIYRRPPSVTLFPIQLDYNANMTKECGGTIVTSNTIVTAAHCVFYVFRKKIVIRYKPKDLRVLVGHRDIKAVDMNKVIIVERLIVHPGYRPVIYLNDIAMLKLVKNVPFNKVIQPMGMHFGNVGVEVSVYVAGWGKTCNAAEDFDHLRYAVIKTISTRSCYPLFNSPTFDPRTLICTGPDAHIAEGDSGSGLLLAECKKNCLVGLVSVGFGCSDLNHSKPSSFTKISFYKKWVLHVMKRFGGKRRAHHHHHDYD